MRFVAGGAALVLLIGVLDYLTGPQISSSLFYLLPVLWVTHHCGRTAGMGMAGLATLIWLIADLLPPSVYAHPAIPYWNAAMRLGVFVVAAWLVARMRALNETLERRVADRSAKLQAETNERLALEHRILEISEHEQARIGQDLHDGLCQQLVGTAFSANLLRDRLTATAPAVAREAEGIATALDECITQARGLARGLYPVRLEEEGLANGLQDLLDRAGRRSGLRCSFECEGNADQLPNATAIHLYRIAQEAVNNALHHARPSHIQVRLECANNCFGLTVADDGAGFEPDQRRAGAMGLRIMEYRARMIGASLKVEHPATGGTRVSCVQTTSSPGASA